MVAANRSSRCSGTTGLGLPLFHDGGSPTNGTLSSVGMDLRHSYSIGYATLSPRSRCGPRRSRIRNRLLYPPSKSL